MHLLYLLYLCDQFEKEFVSGQPVSKHATLVFPAVPQRTASILASPPWQRKGVIWYHPRPRHLPQVSPLGCTGAAAQEDKTETKTQLWFNKQPLAACLSSELMSIHTFTVESHCNSKMTLCSNTEHLVCQLPSSFTKSPRSHSWFYNVTYTSGRTCTVHPVV